LQNVFTPWLRVKYRSVADVVTCKIIMRCRSMPCFFLWAVDKCWKVWNFNFACSNFG